MVGKRPWKSYFTMDAITRTKSTAQVMHEAAEEEAESHGVQADGHQGGGGMAKVLTVWDVIAYGIGSTLGAGIFAITGSGAHEAGPAIVVSFCVAAVACLFSAFSYMEFSARVPIAGSAYTFAYVCLGELAAWFVGWNLTLEYAIGAAVVARTWSSNLMFFVQQVGGNYPTWLSSIDVNWGPITNLSPMSAVICLLCMCVLLLGVKESSNMNMFITILNISVILFICILGSFHVDTENWTSPAGGHDWNPRTYFPMGGNGVLTGAATVFFSYIGFDAVTTLSEEVKNPKRDVPIGIIATLIISTLLYIGTSVVVTGMQPWWALDTDAPLAVAFKAAGVPWAATFIAAATVTALTGNTLTSLFGQPRIFYRMAKDGLLFQTFASLHPKTKVPLWGTIYTGVGAALIAFFIPKNTLANMISIGTLLAFSTVCAGVVIMRYERTMHSVGASDAARFLPSVVGEVQQPHLNGSGDAAHGAYSPLTGGGFASSYESGNEHVVYGGSSSAESDAPDGMANESLWVRMKASSTFWLAIFMIPTLAVCVALRHSSTVPLGVIITLGLLCLPPVIMIARMPVCMRNLPREGNFICPLVPYLPCAGIFTNTYLITSLDVWSYVRVVIWTAIGFALYFLYGIFHSTLQEKLTRYERLMAAEAHSGSGKDESLLAAQGEAVVNVRAEQYSVVAMAPAPL